jgi:hypothetical protein
VAPFTGAPSQDEPYSQKSLQHGPKILFSLIVALRKQSEGQNKAVRQMAMSAVDLACVPSVASSPARHSQTAYWAILCKIVPRNRHSWRVDESSSNSLLEQGTTNQPKQGLSLHLKRLLKTHTVPSRVVWKSKGPCAESSRVFANNLCLGRNAPIVWQAILKWAWSCRQHLHAGAAVQNTCLRCFCTAPLGEESRSHP